MNGSPNRAPEWVRILSGHRKGEVREVVWRRDDCVAVRIDPEYPLWYANREIEPVTKEAP
jgi:hypothetical protein